MYQKIALIMGVILFATPAFAENIHVQVEAPDGADVPGVKVVVKGILTNAQATTDANGLADLPGYGPGEYTVTVSLKGFHTQVRRTRVNLGQDTTLDITLSPKTLAEAIVVTGQGPILMASGSESTIDLTNDEGLELDSTRCGGLYVGAALYDAGGGSNRLTAYVGVDFDALETFDLGSGSFYSVNTSCANDVPIVGAIDGDHSFFYRYSGATWTPIASPDDEENSASLTVRRYGDRTFAGAFDPAGSYPIWELLPDNSWDPLFRFTASQGAHWGGIFGTPINKFSVDDAGFYILYPQVFQTFTQVDVAHTNFDGDLVWNQTLYQDLVPGGIPNPDIESDFACTSGHVVTFTTNRSNSWNEIHILDKLTGEPIGPPAITESDLPTDRVHLKRLLKPRGSPYYDDFSDLFAVDEGGTGEDAFTTAHFFSRDATGGVGVDSAPYSHFAYNGKYAGTVLDFPTGRRVGDDIVDQLVGPRLIRFGVRYTYDSLHAQPVYIGPAPLAFAQFADGDGFFSQLVFNNVDPAAEADVFLHFADQEGESLFFDVQDDQIILPGNSNEGVLNIKIPPSGSRIFRTDASGDLVVGSVVASSQNSGVSGVIVFGGSFGLAGVGASRLVNQGFSAPMESRSSPDVNTGIAIVNLEDDTWTHHFQLLDKEGVPLASAEVSIPPGGQRALFVSEFEWDNPIDFSDFVGVLMMGSGGLSAATVIQTRGNQFATMPVTLLQLQ